MEPLVSIIMPIYNGAKYLDKTIQSVLKQSFENFELLLIDDGSSDDSIDICRRYSNTDSRVMVFHQDNKGICAARNFGLKNARGTFISFMDHDDLIEPDMLYQAMRQIELKDADWVKWGRIEHIVDKNIEIAKKIYSFPSLIIDGELLRSNLLELRLQGVLTFVWDGLFRRDIIITHNLCFDEYFKHGNEDIDFCHHYAEYCTNLVTLSLPLYHHYARAGVSTSGIRSLGKIQDAIYLEDKLQKLYLRNQIDYSNEEASIYLAILGKSLIYNSCVILNAQKNMKRKQRIDKLAFVRQYSGICQSEMNYNMHSVFQCSRRDGIYVYLFMKKRYGFLLTYDKYRRKFIYWLRKICSLVIGRTRDESNCSNDYV